jgi:hypothetical protein
MEVVSTHNAGKTTTAGHPDHINPNNTFQRRWSQNLPYRQSVGRILAAKLTNEPLWLALRLRRSSNTGSCANLLPSAAQSHHMSTIGA